MEEIKKLPEKFLYEIWKDQSFSNELSTNSGEKISVIDSGSQNSDLAGPDFKNARIKIGNITFLGDIEIDSFYSDWKTHGHYLSKKYNKVILHTYFKNNGDKPFVYSQEGRKIISLPIGKFIKSDLRSSIQNAIVSEREKRYYKMPCSALNHLVDENKKLDFLYELGLRRFKRKQEAILQRLKELIYLNELKLKEPVVKYDLDEKFYNREFKQEDFNDRKIWQQIFYESIFEALGYSKNKEIMRKLADAVNVDFISQLKEKENFISYLESALFNVSGLMPDIYNLPDEETSEYSKHLAKCWNEIENLYDGITFSAADWHFFKLRPRNFPTLRIAGGAILIDKLLNRDLITKIIKKIDKIEELDSIPGALKSLIIVKGNGFWNKHFVFDVPTESKIKYLVGFSRTDDIIVNVIYPILSIYFEVFGNSELSKKVVKLYTEYNQISENYLVKEVSSTLHLNDAWKRSVLQQGMIDLFRNYCSKDKCFECKIGQEIFC